MSILRFPTPDPCNDGQLTNELVKAGFTDVAVSRLGDEVIVSAAELTDHMPPDEMRRACRTQEELDFLLWATAEEAFKADAGHRAVIERVLSEHVAVFPPPRPNPDDALRAAIEGASDFASLKAALLGAKTGHVATVAARRKDGE